MRWLVAIALTLAPRSAGADPTEQLAEAARLFEEGRALAKQGKQDEACERFRRSWELERAPGTQLNHADCLEHKRELRAAWELFTDVWRISHERGQTTRARFARDRANAIAASYAFLTVRIAAPSPSLVVMIGGRRFTAAAELREVTTAGDVEISARDVTTGKTYAVTIAAIAGRTVTVAIPASLEASAREAPPAPAAEIKLGARSRNRVYLAGGLAGAGGIAVVASILYKVSSVDLREELFRDGRCSAASGQVTCNSQDAALELEKSEVQSNIALGLAVASGALVIGAVVVYYTAPRDRIVVPTATGNTVGIAVSGWF